VFLPPAELFLFSFFLSFFFSLSFSLSLSQRLLDFWLQVDSANKYGTLLEVVQVLTDLKLTINRAYISSDGEWFMDGECRAAASPAAFGKFKKIDEKKRWCLFWGDAKPGFCLGCVIFLSSFFPSSNPDV
jgi:hypothetical protein